MPICAAPAARAHKAVICCQLVPGDHLDRAQAQVKELLDELKEIDNAIAQHASEHIHANEVILTFAAPRTAKLFLQQAAKKRSFQVRCRLRCTSQADLFLVDGVRHRDSQPGFLKASWKGGPCSCATRVH